MIVADCTLIARLILRADPPASVDALLQQHPTWKVPSLWRAEFVSVLLKYERAGRLAATLGTGLLDRALELFAASTLEIPAQRVLDAGRRTGCSPYDSHYVALAEELRLPLYTYDEGILAKCPRLARRPA